MFYRVIGVMSGSSLDGLDIACVDFHFQNGRWDHSIVAAECLPYSEEWTQKLSSSTKLNTRDYLLLDAEYGHFLGKNINRFMEKHDLFYKISLISVHGHTSFHIPQKMTAQLGDGAAIAAETRLPVITGLRAMDIALGGQGAPIVPVSEKLLFPGYDYYLNLGGIANISINQSDGFIAFDICPANKVLNLLSFEIGKSYDEEGRLASEGNISNDVFKQLNGLEYYQQAIPKSLSNEFGTDMIFPLIRKSGMNIKDALATYVEHIAFQIATSLETQGLKMEQTSGSLLVTGGGAKNLFLIDRIRHYLEPMRIQIDLPESKLIDFKEAIAMAFLGVLRWRDEYTVQNSVTGASRPSVGGAIWNGQQ